MLERFGRRSLLNLVSRPFSIICGMKTPVGTTMSYPDVPFAAISLAISSSLDEYESRVIFGPSSEVKFAITSGES
jgi:hypothetical protein